MNTIPIATNASGRMSRRPHGGESRLYGAALVLLVAMLLPSRAQTITWSEDWESPAAQDDWSADHGIWEIGVPTNTNGPPPRAGGWRAYQGTNCAATSLAADYSDDRQSRLVYGGPSGQGVLVPETALNPRLRFWHWWSFSYYDFGQVQVSTNNGANWEALSPKYGQDDPINNYDSSGDWVRVWLDLQPYAGQTVLLGFYFQSLTPGVSSGWYVDDLVIETGPIATMDFPEGFEDAGASERWRTDYGVWQIGQPTSGPGVAHTGVNCLVTVLDGDYTDDRRSRIRSVPLTVPEAALNPRLRFWHWWSFSYYDFGQVQISTNNGASWTDLSPQYSDTSSGWTQSPSFSLSQYAGQTVLLGFYFHSQAPGVSSGWYVDDIQLLASGYPPMITAQPTNQTAVVGSPVSFTVSVSPLSTVPLSYQWRFEGTPIDDATNTTYSIAGVQLTNKGGYDVVITNIYGAVTSVPPAQLTVLAPWGVFANHDVGDVGSSGSYTLSLSNKINDSVFTVTGSGEDIEDTADAFQFVHQPLTGDGQIMARLVSLQGGNPLAEAGLMMRESLDTGSRHVFVALNQGEHLSFRRRLTPNDYSRTTARSGTNVSWLRLARMGTTFVAHTSTNGVDWDYLWFTMVTMPSQVEVGLAVSAHSYGEVATARFDNLTLGSLTALSGVWPLSGPKILLGGEPWNETEFQRVGGFEFLVGGVVGDVLTINTSPDLTAPLSAWTALGTVTNRWGVVDFVDPQTTNHPQRFYRLLRQGP